MSRLSRRRLLRTSVSAGVAAVAGCGSRDSASEEDDSASADGDSRDSVTEDGDSSDPASFLALGDSYTAGTGVSSDDRWADRLPERLRELDHALAAPTVVASTGWTTNRLREEARERELAPGRDGDGDGDRNAGHDLVTLCIGANDSAQGLSSTEFRPRFEELLEDVIRYTGDRPANALVLTIPDYTLTPIGGRYEYNAHRERIDAYNEAIELAAAERGTRLVDLVEPSRKVADDPDLVADDGLHPSAEQHGLWLDRIVPVVAEILAE